MESRPCSQTARRGVPSTRLSAALHRLSAGLSKSQCLFGRDGKADLKICIELLGIHNSQNNLGERTKSEDSYFPT